MAKLIRLQDGKRFQMGGGDSRRLVDPDVGASRITLNYSVFQPGHEFPQHIHDASADVFIVLEGGVSVRQGEVYTPIVVGDLAYIPAGEVHGTVNQTADEATLISFQSPPDTALYRGERDPSVTGGTVPTPPPGHVSQVQIRTLTSGEKVDGDGSRVWTPVGPAMGAQEMTLSYWELEPGVSLSVPAVERSESVWFVRSGQASLEAGGETLEMSKHSAAFVAPGEEQTIANASTDVARLIRCQAPAPQA
jgi:mannose-6-phosphate isomerase-like protein (cupin superfamily)